MIGRIIQIREGFGLNQEEFAKKIGLSRNFINQVENGKKNFSDRTISDICREFSVNETWLRTGKGEPTIKRTHNQKIQAFANDVMELPDEDFKKKLIYNLASLEAEDWEKLLGVIEKLLRTDDKSKEEGK